MSDEEATDDSTYVTLSEQCPKCGAYIMSKAVTVRQMDQPGFIPVFEPHVCRGTREPNWDARGTR